MNNAVATSVTMRRKDANFLQLIALVYMMPVKVNLLTVGAKPVDLAVSSFLVFLTFFLSRAVNKAAFVATSTMLFFPIVGILSSISQGGSPEALLSAFNFFLPMVHILVGALVARSFSIAPEKYFARALAIVVITILFSDILLGQFPRGCGFQGRLGGCFGPFEVYGFPNASMNFLVVVAPILVFLFSFTRARSDHLLALAALTALVIITPMSLSRSATIIMGFSLLFFVHYFLDRLFIFGVAAVFGLIYFNFEVLLHSTLGEGVALRMFAAIEAGDISTGRFGIWKVAFDEFSRSPFFGSSFEFFSNFSEFGTAHQQYLEVLFKAGIVGFILYFGVFFVSLFAAFQKTRHIKSKVRGLRIRVVAMISFSLLISNLFQPAMSYQVFGNFLFFWCGYFFSFRGYHE